MITVRTSIEIRQGERVELLFTPRLYSFKGLQGITLCGDTTDMSQVYSLYADILFCAYLNLWTLQGNEVESAAYTRVDFHEFSATNPQSFGKVIDFALKALSGKSLAEHIAENKVAENGEKSANEEVKKKTFFAQIMARLKHS